MISYGNTIKKRRDIAYAASCGVRRYTIDAEAELEKLIDVVPGASVCVRLRHECGGADWPLSRKFGCDAAEVTRLLVLAAGAGMETGVSFHVGSQQRDLGAWDDTLEVVAGIFARATELGARADVRQPRRRFPRHLPRGRPVDRRVRRRRAPCRAALVPRRAELGSR